MFELRDRLRLVLARARSTPAALAARVKVPARMVREVVEGRCDSLPLSVFHKLATGLQCSPDWLLDLSDEEPTRASLRAAIVDVRADTRDVRSQAVGPRLRSVLITAEMAAPIASGTCLRAGRSRSPSASMVTLKERLRRLLRDAGISQAELTRVARLPSSFLSELMRSRTVDADTDRIARVSAALGVSLAWLIGVRDDEPDLAGVRRRFVSNGGRVKRRANMRDPMAFDENDERPIVAPDEHG